MPFGLLGRAQRFAGDALSNAYNGVDSQFGGILPGGVEADGTGLVSEIAKDMLPGDRKVTGTGVAKKANAASANITEGNIAGASAQLHGGRAGAQGREFLAEEARDKIISKVGQRAATGPVRRAAGVLAPPLAIADGINDAKDAYSTYLDIRTGKDLEGHMSTAAEKRDPLYGVPTSPTYVGPADGSIPTIEQRDEVNPFMQELQNRAALVSENFNPGIGEFGVTEALYGK